MATIDYKQLATPEANLIELLSAQNQDGTYTAKLMGSEPFAVLAAKTIYNAYNDIEDNMAADVEGPASSTDNALARFDGTTGKLLQNSNAILTDAGALSLASNLTVSGTSTLNGTINSNGAKAVNVTPTMTPLSGNLYGLYVQPTINSGASAGGTVSGLTVAATNSGTSNVTNIAGIEFIGGNGAASGSMQDLKAFRSSPINLSTGQIVNLYQFYATNAYNPSGTINTQYGLYVDALTSAMTNYAIYTAGTAPSVLGGNLTVNSYVLSDRTASANNAAVNGFSGNFGSDGTLGTLFVNVGGFPSATAANRYIFINAGDNQDARKLVLQRDGGNLLIGTTTDGGQKLQVNGTIAASLGVSSNGSLAAFPAANSAAMDWNGGYARFWGVGADASTAGGLKLVVSSTDGSPFVEALTIASSGDATFAGNVTASGGTALFQATNANSIVHIKANSDTYNPYIRLEGYNRNIYVGVKDAGADGTFNISTAAALTSPMLSLDPATNGATFAGAIAIGNTVQTAAGVSSTHKVTISIGGTTYYLLATNV